MYEMLARLSAAAVKEGGAAAPGARVRPEHGRGVWGAHSTEEPALRGQCLVRARTQPLGLPVPP